MEHPIELLTSRTAGGDAARLLGKLEANGKAIPIIRAVANWDAGFRPFVLMADALLSKGVLPPRRREVLVLHIAARLGLVYEWREHVAISASAGVTEAERAALADGEVPSVGDLGGAFDATDVAALRFAGALLDGGELAPAAWDDACTALGADGAREIVFAVAWWGGFVPVVARSLVALATEPASGSGESVEPGR
jgi:alkylhydroperoxidase/carboxymuconolactone decarboxylase family protein YurZ